jgi:hypothetical protein
MILQWDFFLIALVPDQSTGCGNLTMDEDVMGEPTDLGYNSTRVTMIARLACMNIHT